MLFIKKLIAQFAPEHKNFGLVQLFKSLYSTQCLGSAVLAINAGSAATWKMTNSVALPYLINDVMYRKAAATAQAVPTQITWSAVASTYNAGAFLIGLDNAGNVSTYPTNVTATTTSQAAAVAGIVWPAVPEGVAVIGAIVISTSAANTAFTGATTALDAANITVDYINIQGPFFPTAPI